MSDYVVGSSNFVLVVILLLVSVVVATYARQRWQRGDISPTTLYVLIGASVESFSWATYRAYWLAWRYYKLLYGQDTAHIFFEKAWVIYIPTFGIYVGAGLMMAPITQQMFGKYWATASITFIATLQAIGVLLVAVLKP